VPAPILERWLAAAVAVYGGLLAQQAAVERDPFRNPVGHALRRNLGVVLREFRGGMDASAIDTAFADIMSLRSIQDLSVDRAVGFVFSLRDIARDEFPQMEAADIEARVDRLALSAFRQYLGCRERLATLQLNEQLRALGVARRRAAHDGGAVA
jgi:hypothetical protein